MPMIIFSRGRERACRGNSDGCTLVSALLQRRSAGFLPGGCKLGHLINPRLLFAMVGYYCPRAAAHFLS